MDTNTPAPKRIVLRRAPPVAETAVDTEVMPKRRVIRRPHPKQHTVHRIVTKTAKKELISTTKAAQPVVPTIKKYKNFTKEGQKFETPLKTDPLYKFYTSLLKQKPNSTMAKKWCVERGVFTAKKAIDILLSLEMTTKAKI